MRYSSLFIGLAAISLGVWFVFLRTESSFTDTLAAEQTAASSYQSSGDVDIQRIVEPSSEPSESSSMLNTELSLVEAVEQCLAEISPDPCLNGLDFSRITPEEIAEVLSMSHVMQLSRMRFLALALVQNEAGEVAILMDTVCQILGGDPWDHFVFFEGAISILEAEYPFWIESFVAGLSPHEIFFEGGTDVIAMLFFVIKKDTPVVDKILREGGLGKWGGSPDQVFRAFLVTMSSLERTAPGEEVFGYAYESLRSPFLSEEAAWPVALQCVSFANVMGQNMKAAPGDVEALMAFLLSNLRYQRAAARQFFAVTSSGTMFGGLDEDVVIRIANRAREILK